MFLYLRDLLQHYNVDSPRQLIGTTLLMIMVSDGEAWSQVFTVTDYITSNRTLSGDDPDNNLVVLHLNQLGIGPYGTIALAPIEFQSVLQQWSGEFCDWRELFAFF